MRELARLALDKSTFTAKYGPWAVIAGASEGTGESFAHQLAEMGVNLVLVSRRQDALQALGNNLKSTYGVHYRALAQDLSEADAGKKIVEACADIDVGLYISNAGADSFHQFFEEDADPAHRLVAMNITTLIDAANGFGKRFIERGRGGLVVMASGAGLGGQPNLAMYSATKAFEINLAESLWAEYHERGIDVIAMCAPLMNTPTLRNTVPPDFDLDLTYDPADVTHNALAGLLAGEPLLIVPDGPDQDLQPQVEIARKNRVVGFVAFNKQFTGG